MKKTMSVVTIALALGLTLSAAHADEMDEMKGYCPMMTLKHAKDLGLSKKQEAKIKGIKERMWEQVKPLMEKSSAEVEEVLTPKQEAKYNELAASMGMGGKKGCCGKDKDGGSCPMKDDKHDQD
jgi:Spy/CpxP family protein refolding chaperone